MKAALAWLLLLTGPPTVVPGTRPAHPKPEQLIGTWHSRTRLTEGTVTIQRDGTFQYRPHSQLPTITGLWRLQGSAIVWSYTPAPGVELDPSTQPDVNAIVELSPDRFVLRETDDSLSVFTRLQPREATRALEAPQPLGAARPLESPKSEMPGLAERLWAAVVVAVLLALAFVAWRQLRARSSTAVAPRIYPCLKQTAWADLAPTVRRPLADLAGAEWMPWVAFGYDHPHTFVFVPDRELQESGRSAPELEAEALANLRDREASWQTVEIGLKSGLRLQVAMCSDDFFAAERILEPESILEAQRRLGASALLSGVPRRGLLALIDADAGTDAIAWFVVMVADEYFGGQSAPISPMIFRMSGGRIVGALPSPPRPAA
jgi:uncharacterized protein YtpQ (UPF0354 family)